MAVYTQITASELEVFWAGYDLPALTGFTGISEGTENSNYKIETETHPYILTLYEKRMKVEELPFFIMLMQHLAGQGIKCPLPVAVRDGAALRQLAGRPAVVTTFLPGASVRRGASAAQCLSLGASLAQMHNAVTGFSQHRANSLSVSGWAELVTACAPRADEVQAGLGATLTNELSFLQTHWPQDLPRGVIHADLFPDNVFFKGDDVSGLIDFYFACSDFLAYDLAICLNAWCFEDHVAFNITKARALLRGYHAVRPLSAAEMVALPLLCRGAALRFLLTRLYDVLHPKGGTPRDPLQYLKRLQFHQQVQGVGEYGLEGAA
jgi:homoserine kinase type II